jgi:hypothetical protein
MGRGKQTNRKGNYNYAKKTGTHSFWLGHGHVVAMASSPQGKSFQQTAVHRVPYKKSNNGQGWRLNLTIRTLRTDSINDPLLLESSNTYDMGEGCKVLVWEDLFTEIEIQQLQVELLDLMSRCGIPDVCKMYGKTFENAGRKVLEMADQPDFKYHYAGKTVTGVGFTPLVRQLIVPRMSKLFGVSDSEIWGHLVYYPTPECKLDWHDDGEDGINPHLIVSLTFLEDPINGARAFETRLKSSFGKFLKSD